jgi:hypothetical protein
MAVTKASQDADITPSEESAKIQFICPVCKCEKALNFPKSVITNAKGLTTMSIAKGLVCEHQFQAFVDKNCAVRGYQRVDFEFATIHPKKKKSHVKVSKVDDKHLFENLILEGDYLEYNPIQKVVYNQKIKQEITPKSDPKKRTLKEIYDEFWEFIDEDNSIFQSFIKNDIRKK